MLQPPPIQNVQMMRAEHHEEDTSTNMVRRNGVTEGGNTGGARGDPTMGNPTVELKQARAGPNED